jgi:DNA-binding SARP family transcriptional activator
MSTVSAAPAATNAPRVRLLGNPALLHGSKAVPLEADRAHGLLALLGCRRDWVRRDELADLLYPGRDLDSARSNLRKVVFLARKVDGVGEIEQRGDLLRWAPDSDLARFEAACDARRHGDAVALYGGTLLLGLDPAWPKAARDWLDAERQRLQSRWHDACTRRLAELSDEPEALRALAEMMLRHDPLDDVALQALARAQQALGRADEALAAVADYALRVTEELRIEPSAAVRQLADDLRSASPVPAPAPPAALIGRRHEHAQVRERLKDPGIRLLTLLGPPGVGKSALARSLAAEHGGAWVALEPIKAVDEVPAAIATALNLVPDGRLAPWDGLAQVLATRSALVVLDNVETLPLAESLAALLGTCGGLRLVATSRAPVSIAGEWRMPLDGLPLPDLDERDPEVLRANDAVALFERRARPLAPGFNLGAEAADVVQLVHAVEGLPLAIELLAAWRRVMPVRAIVEELAASLDVLEPSAPGERSVRAAFERSWRQLGPAEQRALAQLALLPSPVDREMLRRVVQVPLPVLAALVDRSLLRADDAGRFSLHPLIRRCAEPLAEDAAAVRERHARYAAESLSQPGAPLADFIAHALMAWDWAVAHADAAVINALEPRLGTYFYSQGRTSDGLARSSAAIAPLRARLAASEASANATNRLEEARALCRVLLMHAQLLYGAGDLDRSLETAMEARVLAQQWQLHRLEQDACTREGSVHWQRGAYDAAASSFEHTLALARIAGEGARERRALGWLALVHKARGDYERALANYTAALQAVRSESTLSTNLYLLNNTGNLLRLLGRHAEALAMLTEGLKLCSETRNLSDEPFLLVNTALVHETFGALEEAARAADKARASGTEHGEPMIEAAARLAVARVAARRSRARLLPEVHAALAIAQRLKSMPLRVQCLTAAGVVLAATGDAPFGVALVRWPWSTRISPAPNARTPSGISLRWGWPTPRTSPCRPS